MKFHFVLVGVLCLAGLLGSTSYAGITIDGTKITFSDNSIQSTAGGGGAPDDHGGTGNIVSGSYAFIGGGYNNLATDDYTTVSGGRFNQAGNNLLGTDDAASATVGGGYTNTASGHASTVGGGYNNEASGELSTIAGGVSNVASGEISTVAGGAANMAMGTGSAVMGGAMNQANGDFSTVAGGTNNVASGIGSFAVGNYALASHNNSFVWGGAGGARTSAGVDTFNVWSADIYLNGAPLIMSDRNMKEAFSFVSAREVLDKVVEMPVTTWRFKSEDDSIRHIGPVAQDFMETFGYGKSDKHITSTDADGVALAAIQGLYAMQREELQEQAEVNTALRWHNAQLKAMLRSRDESFEARFARLEKAILRE